MKNIRLNWTKLLLTFVLIIALFIYSMLFLCALAFIYYFTEMYLISDLRKESNDKAAIIFLTLSSIIVGLH